MFFCGIITKKTFKKLLSHLNDSSGHSRFVRYQGKATLFALQYGVAKGKSVTWQIVAKGLFSLFSKLQIKQYIELNILKQYL